MYVWLFLCVYMCVSSVILVLQEINMLPWQQVCDTRGQHNNNLWQHKAAGDHYISYSCPLPPVILMLQEIKMLEIAPKTVIN